MGLCRPDGLREGEPLSLVFGRVGELVLGGKHGRHAPEALIVVSERSGVVLGHVVVAVTSLVQHALHDDVVVARVAGELPVVCTFL